MPQNNPFQVNIRVDASAPCGPWRPIHRFFGADEPNYAYFPHGSSTLSTLGHLGRAQTYFRAHNLLTTGDGTPDLKWGSTNMYTEDSDGNPVYDWTIVDRIFDAYLARGVKPYVQVGFMPQALSSRPEPYKFVFRPEEDARVISTGWTYPPRSYEKWAELVYQWARHCVERFGEHQVQTWYWEVWNEPNIFYWNGSREEFFKLHDFAVDAVRRAIPKARVGGPEVAGGSHEGVEYLDAFLKHTSSGKNHATGEKGGPLDFVSFHAKGMPEFVDGELRMGIKEQLTDIGESFKCIASHPEYKDTPIVIGEDDPDGCAAGITPALGYRNGTLYPSFTAAAFVRSLDLAEAYGVNLEGAITWAFEFEGSCTAYGKFKWFDGFRTLTTMGVDKPIMNIFRMFGKMEGQRISAGSDAQYALDRIVEKGVREESDVGVIASLDGDEDRIAVLVWHYHDKDVERADAEVQVLLTGISWTGSTTLSHYRIDDAHSNSYTHWLRIGSPQSPTPEQYKALQAAGQLQRLEKEREVPVENGEVVLDFTLPIHGTSLLVLERVRQ